MKLQKIENFQKQLKKLLNKNIVDIILFGSFVKGGLAKDIDIALVVKDEINIQGTKDRIKSIFHMPVDIVIINLESIYSPIWLTLIKEGYSVKKNSYLHEIYKIHPKVIFKYSLNKLTPAEKVGFSRGIKAIAKEGYVFLTRAVVMVPLENKNEFMEFLKKWSIYYESAEYELLPVLRKEEF